MEIELCPFCRKREPTSNPEAIKWIKKRMDKNDPIAFHRLASFYRNGTMGLQKDGYKAMELLHKAAELGSIDRGAYHVADCQLNSAFKTAASAPQFEANDKHFCILPPKFGRRCAAGD